MYAFFCVAACVLCLKKFLNEKIKSCHGGIIKAFGGSARHERVWCSAPTDRKNEFRRRVCE